MNNQNGNHGSSARICGKPYHECVRARVSALLRPCLEYPFFVTAIPPSPPAARCCRSWRRSTSSPGRPWSPRPAPPPTSSAGAGRCCPSRPGRPPPGEGIDPLAQGHRLQDLLLVYRWAGDATKDPLIPTGRISAMRHGGCFEYTRMGIQAQANTAPAKER